MAELLLEKFKINNKCQLNSEDISSLTLLYLPLIGLDSLALYQTLCTINDEEEHTFKELINVTTIQTLSNLNKAFEKIEGIGLLKTYYNKEKGYLFDVISPLKEKEFIETSRNGGIGLVYWLKNKVKILTNQGILLKTKDKVQLKKIPKYFMRKWKDETPIYENPENFYKYKYNQMKQGKENWNNILKNTSQTESDYLKTLGEILKEKAKILRRDNLI